MFYFYLLVICILAKQSHLLAADVNGQLQGLLTLAGHVKFLLPSHSIIAAHAI